MIAKYFIYSFIFFVLIACNKEDDEEGKASYADVDWYAIQDSDDPLDHLIYQCYDEYGVAIFYNDTIGSVQTGMNLDGTPRVHHEVLDVNYLITSTSQQNSYAKCGDRDALLVAVEFLKANVLPRLPASVQPRCYFLTDSCITYRKTYYIYDPVSRNMIEGCDDIAWRSLNTTMIGRVGRMKDELPLMRAKYAGEILAADITLKLINHYALKLDEFYNLSESVHVPEVIPGSAKKTIYGLSLRLGGRDYPFQHWNLYGFLNFSEAYHPDNQGISKRRYNTPSREEDLRAFVAAYYEYSEEEFKNLYADYDVILDKYEVIKDLIEKM